MPRDLPLGNGSLLVPFDKHYQIRDLYWPHEGQENHALGHAFRLGVWVDGQFRWLDDGRWERKLRYLPETLVADVTLKHPDLGIVLRVADAVDFHENLLVRRFEIQNRHGQEKEVRLAQWCTRRTGAPLYKRAVVRQPINLEPCGLRCHRAGIPGFSREAEECSKQVIL